MSWTFAHPRVIGRNDLADPDLLSWETCAACVAYPTFATRQKAKRWLIEALELVDVSGWSDEYVNQFFRPLAKNCGVRLTRVPQATP